jgi:hypothetical protein
MIGRWSGVLGLCREQLQRGYPDTHASVALARRWDSLLEISRHRVHGDVLPPTQLFASLWRVESSICVDVSPQESREHISLDGSGTALATGMYPKRERLFLPSAADTALSWSRYPGISFTGDSASTLSLAKQTRDELTRCSIPHTAPVVALERLVRVLLDYKVYPYAKDTILEITVERPTM